MSIIEDKNWYTVYDKDGVYMACYQDKDWARFAARQYGGRYVITNHYVAPPSTADGGDTYFKRDDTVVYLFYLCIVIIITTIIFLIF